MDVKLEVRDGVDPNKLLGHITVDTDTLGPNWWLTGKLGAELKIVQVGVLTDPQFDRYALKSSGYTAEELVNNFDTFDAAGTNGR